MLFSDCNTAKFSLGFPKNPKLYYLNFNNKPRKRFFCTQNQPGQCRVFYLEQAMTDRAELSSVMDADMERDIEALDLTAPRVTPEQIDALMAGVTYHTHVIPGTTTTVATAIATNGFTLAIGMTACADPANFNEEFGVKYAIRDAESKARSQLWKLEGWRLKCELHA
jgi:hypothetical protein